MASGRGRVRTARRRDRRGHRTGRGPARSVSAGCADDGRKFFPTGRLTSKLMRVMPDKESALMSVTIGTPPTIPPEQIHRLFAALCKGLRCDFVVALDWEAHGSNPPRGHGEGAEPTQSTSQRGCNFA